MDHGAGPVDLYETLQVHHRAIPEVIDKAYRVLVRKYHPDVHPPGRRAWAHSKMTQLNVAYDILSDATRRAEYDASRMLGRRRIEVGEDVVVAEASLKCFNHPKRPSVKFCWHCGRPICEECFRGDVHGHTICVPCSILVEREASWRPGADTDDRARARRPGAPMGRLGVLVHYGLLAILLAVLLWTVYGVAIGFANTPQQALMLVAGLAIVFGVLVIQRLTWRVICPACGETVGHAGFRTNAPWGEFLAPRPICPRCEHCFTSAELNQTFD
ncbi:MAG: DnaJ domain-containing protein [candidate division WS1 bacterium]|jgi:hypothetical protein|nr:DnaJ domain-containing protein [candidate division WS1 bacterium]